MLATALLSPTPLPALVTVHQEGPWSNYPLPGAVAFDTGRRLTPAAWRGRVEEVFRKWGASRAALLSEPPAHVYLFVTAPLSALFCRAGEYDRALELLEDSPPSVREVKDWARWAPSWGGLLYEAVVLRGRGMVSADSAYLWGPNLMGHYPQDCWAVNARALGPPLNRRWHFFWGLASESPQWPLGEGPCEEGTPAEAERLWQGMLASNPDLLPNLRQKADDYRLTLNRRNLASRQAGAAF
jgi:hypothetical protein